MSAVDELIRAKGRVSLSWEDRLPVPQSCNRCHRLLCVCPPLRRAYIRSKKSEYEGGDTISIRFARAEMDALILEQERVVAKFREQGRRVTQKKVGMSAIIRHLLFGGEL